MSALWTGQLDGDDRSGVAIFTEGDVTAEIPLADVQMFHALCAVIDNAKMVARLAERHRLRKDVIRAIGS